MPVLSAIITTYKRDVEILERALLSIINQTYKDIEIIIINDYPEECENNQKIKSMIEKYSNVYNIKYLMMIENGGACKARNLGLRSANGKYIAFLDDDDEWMYTKAEKMIDVFKNNLDVKMVYSNAVMLYEDKNKNDLLNKKIMPSGIVYKDLLKRNIIGSCSFPMFDKEALMEINGYNEKMPASQDWELYIRFSKNNKLYYINEALTKFHVHAGDRISKNVDKRRRGAEILFNEFREQYESDKELMRKYIFNRINIELDVPDYKEAVRLWKKAFKINTFGVRDNLRQLLKIVYRSIFKIRKI